MQLQCLLFVDIVCNRDLRYGCEHAS